MFVIRGITVLCCCFAALDLAYTILGAQSAPQQAAGAAIACAMVIIPYVFTRMLEAEGEATEVRRAKKALEVAE
jgi:hypothetical protein